jgi:hypothetical protein
MGAKMRGVFCSGRTVCNDAKSLNDNKKPFEGDKSICRASQAVKVTVNATANPINRLLRS